MGALDIMAYYHHILDGFKAVDWVLLLLPLGGLSLLVLTEKFCLAPPPGMAEWLGGDEAAGAAWFPRTAACVREWTHSLQGLKDGYARFGSQGQFYVGPDALFLRHVMVPREHVGWMLGQASDVLSSRQARYDRFALEVMLPEQDEVVDHVFLDTVHRKMARNLGRLQPVLADEIGRAMDAALGAHDRGWVEANVWQTVEKTVFPALMSVLVGRSVCRSDEFRVEVGGFVKAFGVSLPVVGRMVPRCLRPTLGWLMSGWALLALKRVMGRLAPLVEERMAAFRDMGHRDDYDPPEDLITWTTEALQTKGTAARCTPLNLTRRMAIMIPAGVPVVVTTTANAIYDILSCAAETRLQELLYAEMAGAVDPALGLAESGLLLRLACLNSAVRESMRLNPATVVTLERTVLARAGVTLPTGQHLPRGTRLAVPTVGVHADDAIYPDAAQYRPFRFCSRDPTAPAGDQRSTAAVTSTSTVAFTDTFLAFGAGRGACPGRWLATHVVKTTVAYLLYNYEVKPLAQRPPNWAILGQSVCDSKQTMVVRRRVRKE